MVKKLDAHHKNLIMAKQQKAENAYKVIGGIGIFGLLLTMLLIAAKVFTSAALIGSLILWPVGLALGLTAGAFCTALGVYRHYQTRIAAGTCYEQAKTLLNSMARTNGKISTKNLNSFLKLVPPKQLDYVFDQVRTDMQEKNGSIKDAQYQKVQIALYRHIYDKQSDFLQNTKYAMWASVLFPLAWPALMVTVPLYFWAKHKQYLVRDWALSQPIDSSKPIAQKSDVLFSRKGHLRKVKVGMLSGENVRGEGNTNNKPKLVREDSNTHSEWFMTRLQYKKLQVKRKQAEAKQQRKELRNVEEPLSTLLEHQT